MRYPFSRVHKNIINALSNEFKQHNKSYRLPVVVDLVPSDKFSHYMKGFVNKIGLVLEINLKPAGSSFYKSNWGSWNGDYERALAGVVNSDKSEKTITSGLAVGKWYIDYHQHFTVGEVLMHPDDMPTPIPPVELSKRERSLMFVFGSLKDRVEREMALSRLGAMPVELNDLIKKKAIKQSDKGLVITLAGAAARLDVPQDELW